MVEEPGGSRGPLREKGANGWRLAQISSPIQQTPVLTKAVFS